MRCVKCGKESENLLCSKCFLEENPVIKSFKEPHLSYCTECGKFKVGPKWIEDSLSEALEEVFSARISNPYSLESLEITPMFTLDECSGKAEVIVVAYSKKYDVYFEDRYIIPASVECKICKRCRKKGEGYFESKVQLRNPGMNMLKYAEKSKYSRKEKVNNGFDFYFSSHSEAQILAEKLQNKFGGIKKKSAKLHTRDSNSGKNVYRTTFLVRFPDYREGDVISNGSLYKIVDMGKTIIAFDLLKCKKVELDYNNYAIRKVYSTRVVKTHPNIEVLHPENYQSTPIDAQGLSIDQKVKVAEFNGRLYIVK